MPSSSPTVMKLRSQMAEKRIGNSAANGYIKKKHTVDSDDETSSSSSPLTKGKRGSAAIGRKGPIEKPIPKWLVYLLLFVVVGGSVVQIFNNISTQPSMSDSH